MIERRALATTRRTAAILLAVALCGTAAGRAAEEAAPATTSAPAPLADARLAFLDGVLAFRRGDFEAARAAFEEAVRLAPDDANAREWLRVTRANLGRPESELVAAPGWSGGDFAVLPQVPRFDGRLFVGFGSDSNPNLMPDGLVLATPAGDPVAGADSDTVALADVRLGFQAVDEAAGRSLGLVLHAGQSLHDQFGYLDLRRLGGVAQLALGKDPLGYVTGPFGYARVPFGRSRLAWLVQLGWQSDSLDGDGLDDALLAGTSVALDEPGGGRLGGQTWLGVSYRDSDFDGDPPGTLGDLLGRSGTELRGELAQYLFFAQRNRYLRLDLAAGERNAGEAFDASSLEGGAELALPLAALGAPRWTAYATGSYRRDDYDHSVSNRFAPAGEPRQDRVTRLGASLVYRVVADLFLSGRVTWIDHRIDMPAGFAAPDLSYDRTLATLGLSWVF